MNNNATGVSVRHTHKLQLVARAGYAARGIVYVIVGILAALAALGGGGETTDSRGALSEVLRAPFGRILLALLALGFLGYAAWRAIQTTMDADRHGTDLKGLVIRAGLGVSAIVHTGLAFFAAGLALGWGSGDSGGSSSREWTATLLSQPYGQWLVAAVGLATAGAGAAHIFKAWQGHFARRFDMTPRERDFIMPVSRFGLCARGIAFLIIGGFFMVAAMQHDPGEARGLSGALQALQQQRFGWLLLGVLAAGLVSFGGYSLIESFYRRVNVPV